MKLVMFLCTALLAGCGSSMVAQPMMDLPSLDSRIEALMAREDVKGMAIAIIDGDDITHLRTYGYRNVEKSQPLETDTIMYGASLTKAAFAYMVLQLVDEGKIELDKTHRRIPRQAAALLSGKQQKLGFAGGGRRMVPADTAHSADTFFRPRQSAVFGTKLGSALPLLTGPGLRVLGRRFLSAAIRTGRRARPQCENRNAATDFRPLRYAEHRYAVARQFRRESRRWLCCRWLFRAT